MLCVIAGACVTCLLTACAAKPQAKAVYEMGERIVCGSLTYNVIETDWRSQLGSSPTIRVPERNFFLVRLSVTNGYGHEVSLPLFTLEGLNGDSFTESSDGGGVEHWFGLLRKVAPAQTEEGWLLFDVPTNAYRLKVTDAAETGKERVALVMLPLKLSRLFVRP